MIPTDAIIDLTEAVEAAAIANAEVDRIDWNKLSDEKKQDRREEVRLAVTAAAPLIIIQFIGREID